MKEDEYRALRLTIQHRGTARMVVLPVVFLGWAATAVAAAAVITVPISTLVPLLVERIGRYLQVFHEADGGWERVAMLFGQRFPGAGPDPLFGRLFVLATSVNFLPAALGFETIPELVLLAIPHFVFINRVRLARAFAAAQRTQDLERFTSIAHELSRRAEGTEITETEGTEDTGQKKQRGAEARS